jgi:hypothetical protein
LLLPEIGLSWSTVLAIWLLLCWILVTSAKFVRRRERALNGLRIGKRMLEITMKTRMDTTFLQQGWLLIHGWGLHMADEMALYGFSASTAQLTEYHHVCLLNLVCYLFDIYFFIPAPLYKPAVHVDTIDTPVCYAD